MGTVYRRHRKLWIKFKDEKGKWQYKPTRYTPDQRDLARKLLHRVEAKVAAGEVADGGKLTLEKYGRRFIKRCRRNGQADWKNEESRLVLHVFPTLGSMLLADVRPRHLTALFDKLIDDGAHKRKTLKNIYDVIRRMYKRAVKEEVVEMSPCILDAEDFGPVEGDEWRALAVFDRDELESFISDPRIPFDQQVIWALQGVGGLRHGEAAALRWFHWQQEFEPLGRIIVARSNSRSSTKTGPMRLLPVHPVLAEILTEWKHRGWEQMIGRPPEPGDLLIPCPKRQRTPAGKRRDKNYSRKMFLRDLTVLGFRHRRMLDLRRTMISLSRMDGARKELLERCTHTPGGKKGKTAIDLYSSFDWKSLCAEIAKLKLLDWDGGDDGG